MRKAYIVILLLNTLSIAVNAQQIKKVPLNWQVGMKSSKTSVPKKYYSATVPGAVQLDYMKANKRPDFNIASNVKEYAALEDNFWEYKVTFAKPSFTSDQAVVFDSKGIDYEFDIILNGKKIFYQEGMFTPVNLDITDGLEANNTLKVVIYPIPKDKTGAKDTRDEARMSAKPAVSYGWDWHPRLVPVGIWDETSITVQPKTRILNEDVSYTLNDALSSASVKIDCDVVNASGELSYDWKISDAAGKVVTSTSGKSKKDKVKAATTVDNINLWWPFDHGTPYQYVSELTVKDAKGTVVYSNKKKIGFRKLALVMAEGSWVEPQVFPKSRSTAPFTLMVNDKFVFTKGSNWVHPEIFGGAMSKERYLEQLLLVKKCNMNMLRIWGGGITNREPFFDQCDSLGILVWQEFPLACNNYPDDEGYLKVLKQEATSIIKRVKQHPSLAMWSGGNELFNNWSGMTEQSLALRLLNTLCYKYDRNTPFIYTSPIYGVGHGHYIFYEQERDEDVFQLMRRTRGSFYTAYTEFGMPSLAPVDVLKRIIPKKEWFPVEPTEAWTLHNAFGAWKQSSWLEKHTLEKYFGKAKNLEELVDQSQLLQSIGYKAIFEESRRQKPSCSMAINWCFNEPWNNAANNNLIVYPNIIKPAFYAVSDALRPVMASAAFERFDWLAGTPIEIEMWMFNDKHEKIDGGKMSIYLTVDEKKMKIGSWDFAALEPNKNLQGPTVRYEIPADIKSQLVKVTVEVDGKPEYKSDYYVLFKETEKSNAKVRTLNF